jgi:hypothetical protein
MYHTTTTTTRHEMHADEREKARPQPTREQTQQMTASERRSLVEAWTTISPESVGERETVKTLV